MCLLNPGSSRAAGNSLGGTQAPVRSPLASILLQDQNNAAYSVSDIEPSSVVGLILL